MRRVGSRGLQLDKGELLKAVHHIHQLLEKNFKIRKKGGDFYFSKPKRTFIQTSIRMTHPYEGRRVRIPVELYYQPKKKPGMDVGFEGAAGLTLDLKGVEIYIPPRMGSNYPLTSAAKDQLFLELRKVLVHELVHIFDKSIWSDKNKDVPDSHFKSDRYYQEPAEAIAALNEFIEETRYLMRQNMNESPSDFTPAWILSVNESWYRAKDDLTPKQKKKFMRALGTLYQEWLKETQFDGKTAAHYFGLAARVAGVLNGNDERNQEAASPYAKTQGAGK